ncbi:MAG: hypothetical protein HGB28_01335 [Oscillochloris sp.]|nr:hypothetical protein [Oscillochloris sp.]
MTTQNDYSAEEWNTILQAPGFAVTFIIQSATYSQAVALTKMLTGIEAIVQTAEAEPGCDLVQSVRAAIMSGQRPRYPAYIPANLGEARQVMLRGCRQAVALLAQRAPEDEANAYLGWILEIVRIVAAVPSEPAAPGHSAEETSRQTHAAIELLARELGLGALTLALCP